MVQYKLYYFPFKGLGESVRLVLHQAGVEFEDHHVPKENWPNHKSKATFGQMPVLDVDGKHLTQCLAICRYIGQQHGLVPKDPWQAAKADELASAWSDMGREGSSISNQPDPAAKAAKLKVVQEEWVKPRFAVYEKHYSESKSGLTADEVCWADFCIYNYLKMATQFYGVTLENYPSLTKFTEKVEHLPNVRKFVESRKDVIQAPITFVQ